MVSSTSAIVEMSVGPSASGGVSSTDSPVNSESKYRVSVSDITCGLNGGSIYTIKGENADSRLCELVAHGHREPGDVIHETLPSSFISCHVCMCDPSLPTFFASRSCQLMFLKKAWFMISRASSGPPPRRSFGSLMRRPLKSSRASCDILLGNRTCK